MKINKFFIEEYLTAGKTKDNFIFENCPTKFLKLAKEKLSKDSNGVKSCCIVLTSEIESVIEKLLNNSLTDFQKQILSRDFITALIVKEVLKESSDKQKEYNLACQQIKAFLNNDYSKVVDFHSTSFMPYNVQGFMKEIGKIELNFFLENTTNKYLQQAINLFVSSREPYSVKIFTNNKNLPNYYDQCGNIIQCPHDFMRRNVNSYIENEDELTK